MDELTLIGVSHRRGGADALDAYARAFATNPAGARLAAINVDSYLTLLTCNRLDVVCVRPPAVPLAKLRSALSVDDAPRRPYVYAGEAALEHLARVAASLDSLNPGEDQVMGQVRDALTAARAAGRVDGTLSFAVDAALRVARSVRREVPLAPRDTSLFSLARPEIETLIASVGDRPRAVVLGAGEMASLAVRSLAAQSGLRVTVVNRDEARGRALAGEHGAAHRALRDVARAPLDAELLVSAIGGGRRVGARWLDRMPSLRLAVDLGIPRTIDAEAARERNVSVLDVDGLKSAGEARRGELEARLADAERVLRAGVETEMRAWAERSLAPSIRALQGWLESTLQGVLPPTEARLMARRLAFVPVKGLRAVAREHGVAAARTFLAETGLDRPWEGSET